MKYNSALKPEDGDALVIGATSLEQLEETLERLRKGPVGESAAREIEGIWESVKREAVLDLIHQ